MWKWQPATGIEPESFSLQSERFGTFTLWPDQSYNMKYINNQQSYQGCRTNVGKSWVFINLIHLTSLHLNFLKLIWNERYICKRLVWKMLNIRYFTALKYSIFQCDKLRTLCAITCECPRFKQLEYKCLGLRLTNIM